MTTLFPTPAGASPSPAGPRPAGDRGAPAGRPALVITVHGQPATQGSKHARPIYKGRGADKVFTGKVAQVESSKEKHTTWREAVKSANRKIRG